MPLVVVVNGAKSAICAATHFWWQRASTLDGREVEGVQWRGRARRRGGGRCAHSRAYKTRKKNNGGRRTFAHLDVCVFFVCVAASCAPAATIAAVAARRSPLAALRQSDRRGGGDGGGRPRLIVRSHSVWSSCVLPRQRADDGGGATARCCDVAARRVCVRKSALVAIVFSRDGAATIALSICRRFFFSSLGSFALMFDGGDGDDAACSPRTVRHPSSHFNDPHMRAAASERIRFSERPNAASSTRRKQPAGAWVADQIVGRASKRPAAVTNDYVRVATLMSAESQRKTARRRLSRLDE